MGKADERLPIMTLFTPDLYRNFGIGFGVGAIAVLLMNTGEILSGVPQLIAAILLRGWVRHLLVPHCCWGFRPASNPPMPRKRW